ncbi:hypothetical protein Zm00014a_015251 [Zea mays]|jgi:hypothetical protein|uniref:Uncharacterized protein n=2 Tax=Zea mays TaxID=4577 RepID=K7VEZ6_MAIZE|nr:uncharacterized protein LOC103638704 [Zea mays]AQL04480.1 hypothetical protein ZEAMMB73_Zm00001d046542 [Zea mays]PWZ06950.1 hypothetical protein Zm00014a_015251 [Zea mays]|eukprot:XP_008659766.1 uncharacterized protein LOC103638704 [Zea mays]
MGGDHHLQLRRPASIGKIAVPEKKSLFLHAASASPGHYQQQQGGASSHEAPAVSVTPRTATNKQQLHLPASPRACLCSPTVHAGSFRCRLHRGVGGGGGGGDSVGSGLQEMSSRKPGV